MTTILPLLKDLISVSGLSGHETAVRRLIEQAWAPLTHEMSTSRLGSLHGLRRGGGPEPRQSILLAAHMDAIGLMVTAIVDGYLRVTNVGGIDARVLPGQLVTVHGREDLPGVIAPPTARLLPAHLSDGVVPLKYLLVDTGRLPEEVQQLVRVGDLVSFAQPPVETAGETLTGHSLDNRASVAVVTACLEELTRRPHAWDVWALASAQEEVNLGGALTSGFELRPTLAVAIDVTFASAPGSPSHKTYPMGKGPTLLWGPNTHPRLFEAFKELAERLEIPYSLELAPRHSGTDGYALQVIAEGIPSFVLGIPLRYMHTPVEMVAIKDITRAGRLLAEFIAQLDERFMDQLTWED